MEEKIYIVTLYKHEDLEQFYNELSGFHLVMKRPMSRNTHYKMTEEQAKKLRQDPRVWDVQLPPEERGMKMFRDALNYTPYNINGDYWKNIFTGTISTNDRQWGHVHCAGDTAQRGKTIFGRDGVNLLTGNSIDVFNEIISASFYCVYKNHFPSLAACPHEVVANPFKFLTTTPYLACKAVSSTVS